MIFFSHFGLLWQFSGGANNYRLSDVTLLFHLHSAVLMRAINWVNTNVCRYKQELNRVKSKCLVRSSLHIWVLLPTSVVISSHNMSSYVPQASCYSSTILTYFCVTTEVTLSSEYSLFEDNVYTCVSECSFFLCKRSASCNVFRVMRLCICVVSCSKAHLSCDLLRYFEYSYIYRGK